MKLIGKEKTYYLIDKIFDVSENTSEKRCVVLNPDDLTPTLIKSEISNILNNLRDKALLEVRKDPTISGIMPELPFNNPTFGKFIVNLLPEFEIYYKNIQEEPGYKAYHSNHSDEGDDSEILYEVKYTPDAKILINGFLLSNPNLNSDNENFFDYVYNHPNKKISKNELTKHNIEVKNTIHNMLNDLNFKGDLRELFFSASKNTVLFRNPITRKMFRDFGGKHPKLLGNSKK